MPSPIGRFAPSPSGNLHFGSLIAAVGSYCDSKAQGGRWLLRIEDIDPPRTVAGASDAILRTLEAHGLTWDGPVLWQSRHSDAYEAALAQLRANDQLYACQCSRTDLLRAGVVDCLGPCRRAGFNHGAWRLRLSGTDRARPLHYHDRLRGDLQEDLGLSCGDFVLKRRDGLYAYQLAVVVDDAASAVTDVVRGADLLDNTARQCVLQAHLGLPRPHYLHLPLALAANGQKLSKQNHAAEVDPTKACANLIAALTFLGQPLPKAAATTDELLTWAVRHWQSGLIPAI